MTCVFQEFHLMDGNGDIQLERLFIRTSQLENEELKELANNMLTQCPPDKVEGNTKCDRAIWVNKCQKMADSKVCPYIKL